MKLLEEIFTSIISYIMWWGEMFLNTKTLAFKQDFEEVKFFMF